MKRGSTKTTVGQGMRALLLFLALLLAFAGCNTTEPPIETSPSEESSTGEETTTLEEITDTNEEMTEGETTTEEETTEEETTEEETTSDGSLITSYGTLSAELVWKIKECYVKQYCSTAGVAPEELHIRYIGEYHGAHVMLVDGPFYFLQWVTGETVAGVNISYPNSQKMKVYHEKSNSFAANITEAYENGWLADEDIPVIKTRYLDVRRSR
ncbi:MAG: hypothetical protein IJD75_04660 [Clostridia bacterium]|nr:hypothetical protein [Clostridia bacterium]